MKIKRFHIYTLILALLFVALFSQLEDSFTGYQSLDQGEYQCGDGKCTIPFEDEILCPQDCKVNNRNITPVILIAFLVLIGGLIYFNFYKGKIDLRKLTKGKNPFKKPGSYIQVKDYIESSLKLGFNKKNITKTLYKKGWNKKQITYAFENVAWNRRKVLIDTAPKVTSKIKPAVEFIKKGLTVSLKEGKIKQALLDKGWKKRDIRKAFKIAED